MCGFVDSVDKLLPLERTGCESVAAVVAADERKEERGGARRRVVVHITNG